MPLLLYIIKQIIYYDCACFSTALHHFNACNHLEFLGAHVRSKQCPHQDPKGPVSPPLHTLEHCTMQCLWPPFVDQNMSRTIFWGVKDNHFLPSSHLHRICNRSTLKLSYRCLPNMDIGSLIGSYTALLYTTSGDGLHFCVHNCTLLYKLTLPTHTCLCTLVISSNWTALIQIYLIQHGQSKSCLKWDLICDFQLKP